MASAWRSGRGYVAEFHPFVGRTDGKAHRQRVPKKVWTGKDDPLAAALAWAHSVEKHAAMMRGNVTSQGIELALALGAISEEQARALFQGIPPPEMAPLQPVTIEQAFYAHPSSLNDTGRSRRRYSDAISAWVKWSGSGLLHDLTLDGFTRYRDRLIGEGYAWDSRRHLLLPLRRAARMAAARYGMPDVLSGLHLDKPEARPMAQAWTLDELRKGFGKLADNLRGAVALGLGGFVGLRPSETIRIRCGDLRKDNRLPYAILPGRAKDAKNHASRRLLPIPPTIAKDMRALAAGRKPTDPLLVTIPGNEAEGGGFNAASKAFTQETFNQWLAPLMQEATGKRLPARCLRKSFATWTRRAGIKDEHREVYLGHETELAQSITGRHYVADLHEVLADELEKTRKKLESALHAPTRGRKALKTKGR